MSEKLCELKKKGGNGGGSGSGDLIPVGKYRSGYANRTETYGQLTEDNIVNNSVSYTTPKGYMMGTIQVNTSQYSQCSVSVDRNMMQLQWVKNNISYCKLIESSSTVSIRTIDLTDIDFIFASCESPLSNPIVMTLNFS